MCCQLDIEEPCGANLGWRHPRVEAIDELSFALTQSPSELRGERRMGVIAIWPLQPREAPIPEVIGSWHLVLIDRFSYASGLACLEQWREASQERQRVCVTRMLQKHPLQLLYCRPKANLINGLHPQTLVSLSGRTL